MIFSLFWKEARDLRPWLFGAPAAALLLVVLNLNRGFERGFQGVFYAMMPLLTLCLAIAMGARQIARERHFRTMDFLLVRPVSPATILWIKFLAGTLTLVILLALAAGLCYLDPHYQNDTGLLGLRQAATYTQLLSALLPRLWCAYSLALLFSVLMTRTATAVGAAGLTFMGVASLAGLYQELYPFTSLDPWLSFFDSPIAMLYLERDPWLARSLDAGIAAAALVLALLTSTVFLRRPAFTLGTRTLVIGGAVCGGLALLSAKVDVNRLPVLAPAGVLDLRCINSKHGPAAMDANNGLVAFATRDALAWLDFGDPAHPRKIVESPTPLWTTKEVTMVGNDAYLYGIRRALPVDEIQVVATHLESDGSVRFDAPVVLGTEDTVDFAQDIAVRGNYLFAEVIRKRECRIEVYNLSGQQISAVAVDRVRPDPPGTPEEKITKGSMQMTLHGNYLYVTSPSALTTLDATNPAQMVVTNRIVYREPIPLFYAWLRPLATDGRWLVETEMMPFNANLYDLKNPAHPALHSHQPVDGVSSRVSDGFFYQASRHGLLEFHVSEGGFAATRHLSSGKRGTWLLAASQGRVYNFQQREDGQFLVAYRVR